MIRYLTLALLVGCSEESASTALTLAGSDTEIGLAQRFAERYSELKNGETVSVRGGGSGAGIAALLEGRIDIATSSRPLKEEEKTRAAEQGLELVERVVAIDALAVIVHPSNSVTELSLDELGALYRGEVKSWAEFGGAAGGVTVYGRQSNSGTYDYFRETVLNDDYTLRMLNMNGNAQIVEGVRRDPLGIGYVGIGYVSADDPSIRIVAIEHDGRLNHPSDDQAVPGGTYPIARPLFMFTTTAKLERVRAFFELISSKAGAAIIRREGFLPPRGRDA